MDHFSMWVALHNYWECILDKVEKLKLLKGEAFAKLMTPATALLVSFLNLLNTSSLEYG